MSCNDVNIYSGTCLIDEGDSFLLTGGLYNRYNRTSRYSSDSWLQDLDDLNTGRYCHACGWYTNMEGKRVGYHESMILDAAFILLGCVYKLTELFHSPVVYKHEFFTYFCVQVFILII